MKIKVEMIVEVSKEAELWEIDSHLRDALSLYEGNEIEFKNIKIKGCLHSLKTFSPEIDSVYCLETFDITNKTQNKEGKILTYGKTFYEGGIYSSRDYKREGMTIAGFWIPNSLAEKFAVPY